MHSETSLSLGADISNVAASAVRATEFTGPVLTRLAEGIVASGMAVAIFSPDDQLVFACPSFVELYDVQPGEQNFDSIIRHCHASGKGVKVHADDVAIWLAETHLKRRAEPIRKFEIDLVDGRWLWATETTYADGWIMVALMDFTALKQNELLLRQARDIAVAVAETDSLTGLYNRGGIMSRLKDAIAQSLTTKDTLSIALIDLDNFKSINDRFGHSVGDNVIKHFADCCRSMFRDKDMLGRVGGEEFLLVMPQTSEADATMAVERLRERLKQSNLINPPGTVYTFSAGVRAWHQELTLDEIYHQADQILYHAKHAGRDRVSNSSSVMTLSEIWT
jgi:diguanylate cyclase (GGDEF)-like protein